MARQLVLSAARGQWCAQKQVVHLAEAIHRLSSASTPIASVWDCGYSRSVSGGCCASPVVLPVECSYGYKNEMQQKSVESVLYIELAGVFQVVKDTCILLTDTSVYVSVKTFNTFVTYTRAGDHRVRTSKPVQSIP